MAPRVNSPTQLQTRIAFIHVLMASEREQQVWKSQHGGSRGEGKWASFGRLTSAEKHLVTFKCSKCNSFLRTWTLNWKVTIWVLLATNVKWQPFVGETFCLLPDNGQDAFRQGQAEGGHRCFIRTSFLVCMIWLFVLCATQMFKSECELNFSLRNWPSSGEFSPCLWDFAPSTLASVHAHSDIDERSGC